MDSRLVSCVRLFLFRCPLSFVRMPTTPFFSVPFIPIQPPLLLHHSFFASRVVFFMLAPFWLPKKCWMKASWAYYALMCVALSLYVWMSVCVSKHKCVLVLSCNFLLTALSTHLLPLFLLLSLYQPPPDLCVLFKLTKTFLSQLTATYALACVCEWEYLSHLMLVNLRKLRQKLNTNLLSDENDELRADSRRG